MAAAAEDAIEGGGNGLKYKRGVCCAKCQSNTAAPLQVSTYCCCTCRAVSATAAAADADALNGRVSLEREGDNADDGHEKKDTFPPGDATSPKASWRT